MEKSEVSGLPTPEGRLLRAWRKYRGLSQDALGALVKKGVDKTIDGSQIGHYERGTNRPGMDQLLDIVLALGVPGASEEEKIARFFAGPEARLISVADVEADVAELRRLQALEHQLAELLSGAKAAR